MSRIGYSQRIRQRIAQLEAAIVDAQSELDELRVAERVLGRLGSINADEEQPVGPSRASTTTSGHLTVADKAVDALTRHGPLDTLSLLAILQAEWRPDLQQTTLSSTLSRTKALGRIAHEDGKWCAPSIKNEEPPEGGSLETLAEGSTSRDWGGGV